MKTIAALLACLLTAACATTSPPGATDTATAREQVIATERAFAKTMADRDHKAFASFIANDTVFYSGPKPLHGKQAVVDFWAKFYADAKAPFSWEPKEVEVLDAGDLAISSGPVADPDGKVFASFTSIWRREGPNTWRIIFDKGNAACNCPPTK